jgi:hypothetical protein
MVTNLADEAACSKPPTGVTQLSKTAHSIRADHWSDVWFNMVAGRNPTSIARTESAASSVIMTGHHEDRNSSD